MRHTWTAVGLRTLGIGTLLLIAGCEYNPPAQAPTAGSTPVTGTVSTNTTTPPTTPAPTTGTTPQPATVSGVAGLAPLDATNPAPTTTTPPAPATEQVQAKAGVTGKGTSYGGGVITEPVRQYFRVQERIMFDNQVPYAMKLYKAANDNKAPATHEEFWKEIIQANGLEGKLPKLPPGHKYFYDPMTEELMVQRPSAP